MPGPATVERRIVLRNLTALAMCSAVPGAGLHSAAAAAQARPLRRFTPEMFGAKGDGKTNDTTAFQALAEAVNRAGGGEILFRRRTYVVGGQRVRTTEKGQYSFAPEKVLELVGCSGALILRGNGATLRCAAGLRYGTFDRATGAATDHPAPYRVRGELATPYRSMIRIENCTGPIEVHDFELDGNIGKLRIGGRYGDTGRQIPAGGLALFNNQGTELVRNLHTHRHGQDGLYIDGVDAATGATRRIAAVRSEHNGRQGCSLVGGRGYDFVDCSFNHTGRGPFLSAPGAGFDIEAQRGKKVRDLTFLRCEFADNGGVGMVADSGDSADATFTECTFVGTTAWSLWPDKPGLRFHRCTIVGSMVRAFPSPDEALATQFHDCVFRDDPALSPTGKVFLGRKPESPAIADLGNNANILFNRCTFQLTHGASLPWSTHAIYQDCRMQQRAPQIGRPRGTYRGRNVITGAVGLAHATIEGELIVNGKRVLPER